MSPPIRNPGTATVPGFSVSHGISFRVVFPPLSEDANGHTACAPAWVLRLTERKDERSLVCIDLAECGRSQRTRENLRMDGHEMQKCGGRQMLDVLQNDIQQTGSMAGIFRVCSQGRDYIYPDQRPDHKLKKDGANEQKRIQYLVWRKAGCYSGAADVDILPSKNV